MPIKKAVIPVAGLGTRFLPATKAIPKEMLPIVDIPNILHIVREAVESGITDIVFITGRHKHSLEEFFDHNFELEETLRAQGKTKLLEIATSVSKLANIISVRQKNPLGLGHAVLCARDVIGDEAFAVLLGDEIMSGKPPVTKQLIDVYENTEQSVIGIMEVPIADSTKYGMVGVKPSSNPQLFDITTLVEKPSPQNAPSPWAIPGRYVFSSQIFDYLEKLKPSKSGEIQLTDAMDALRKDLGLKGYAFQGERFDTGDKLGFVCANVEFALRHPEIGQDMKKYIEQLAERLKNGDKQ